MGAFGVENPPSCFRVAASYTAAKSSTCEDAQTYRPSGETRTRRSWLASPGAPSMAMVLRNACVLASNTCTTPFQCAQTNNVSPSGDVAMPSAPCGITMVPSTLRKAVSTTPTASFVLNEGEQLFSRMADCDPVR